MKKMSLSLNMNDPNSKMDILNTYHEISQVINANIYHGILSECKAAANYYSKELSAQI